MRILHIQYQIRICSKPLKQVPGPLDEPVVSEHSFPSQQCPYLVRPFGSVSWMPHVSPPTLHSSPKKTIICEEYLPTIYKHDFFSIPTNTQIIVIVPSNKAGFNAHHSPFSQHTRSLTGSPSFLSGSLQLLLPSTQKLSK